jgi:hypothetical protein
MAFPFVLFTISDVFLKRKNNNFCSDVAMYNKRFYPGPRALGRHLPNPIYIFLGAGDSVSSHSPSHPPACPTLQLNNKGNTTLIKAGSPFYRKKIK